MIETFCRDCGERYPLGQDHACSKKPAANKSITKGAHATRGDRHSPAAVGQKEPGSSTKPPSPKAAAPVPQIGAIGHVDHGKTSLTAALTRMITAHPSIVDPGSHADDAPKRGRGRPAGLIPFDKKAHDRKMSAERRAKIKAQKGPPNA